MKLYLLTQMGNYENYDFYDSIVVCAENENDAKTIRPDGENFVDGNNDYNWAKSLQDIDCEEIGIANKNQKRGVIITSFNAG